MALTAITVYVADEGVLMLFAAAVLFALVNLPSVTVWTVLGQQMARFLTNPARLRAFNWTMAALLIASALSAVADGLTRDCNARGPTPYRADAMEQDAMTQYLDFEKPLAEIEGKAEELRAMARASEEMDINDEARALDEKAAKLLDELYSSLTPWRKCQVARHPERPHCKDYIDALFTEYTPLAGDRNFADDLAVMGGLARFGDQPVVVIGHEKGQ